jgi:Na+:H+ antiporter, NhaA family
MWVRRIIDLPMKVTKLFSEFLASERASGTILILCTIVSIVLANSPVGESFVDFWHLKIGFDVAGIDLEHSIEHWINDGLMAIFFLLVGLEIKRELYIGELSNIRTAVLPIFAAIGGTIVPALLHFICNRGTATQPGIGIPMATDIAFSLGVLSLLGNRVPLALKIFLAALAIIDDLIAILVIAIFYVSNFSFAYLAAAVSIFGILLVMNRLQWGRLRYYLIMGGVMWYFLLHSGVHATIAGVLIAVTVPFIATGDRSHAERLEHFLNQFVPFLVIPLFAFANTSIALDYRAVQGLWSANSLGIFLGLFIGKPVGITIATFLTVKLLRTKLPEGVSWQHIIGMGFVAGIGFTMSIFVSMLAFDQPEIIQSSKLAVLLTSLVSGTIGFIYLKKIID